MIYSWIAAKALRTEAVPSEVTSLIFFFFNLGCCFFLLVVLGTILFTRKKYPPLRKEEISRASKCL